MLTGPLSRTRYLRDGLILMALKYAVDFLVIRAVTGIAWTPLDYVLSIASLHGAKAAAFPALLNGWLLLWTVPSFVSACFSATSARGTPGSPPGSWSPSSCRSSTTR